MSLLKKSPWKFQNIAKEHSYFGDNILVIRITILLKVDSLKVLKVLTIFWFAKHARLFHRAELATGECLLPRKAATLGLKIYFTLPLECLIKISFWTVIILKGSTEKILPTKFLKDKIS